MIAVRKFGVELEGYMNKSLIGFGMYVNNHNFKVRSDGSLYDKNVDCRFCRGSGRYALTWTMCEMCDGSGVNEGPDRTYGQEIVSPPIHDLNLIYDVYHAMHKHNWTVDSDAGLHIHVDAEDLKPMDFHKVLLFMTAIEPVIYSLNEEIRYSGCNSSPLSFYRQYVNDRINNFDSLNYMFSSSRYTGLNFQAYHIHGTIEFRYFSPQESASKVVKFVELVTRIVEFSKQASRDQLLVIHNKLNNSNLPEACDVLVEVLQLPYDLKEIVINEEAFLNYPRFELLNQQVSSAV